MTVVRFCKRCQAETERGAHGRCKPCARKNASEWQRANPERAKARQAAWCAANPDRKKEHGAEWRAANKQRKLELNRNWYERNREEIRKKAREMDRVWYAENNEKARLIYQNKRAKRRAAGVLSLEITKTLMRLQKGKCACGCKQPLGNDYHIDHIMPIALGGSNTDDNVQLLRSKCNLQKGAKHPINFMQSRGFLL